MWCKHSYDMRIPHLLGVLCCFLIVFITIKQVQAQPVFKEKTGVDLWATGQAEVYFKGHSSLILGGNVQRSSFAGDRLGNSPFDETNVLIGYEHFIRKRWQVGIQQRQNRIVTGPKNFTTGYIRHNGQIESIIFTKKLFGSYVRDKVNNRDDVELGLSTYIGKRFDYLKLPMQTGVRLEAFRNWKAVGDPRRISRTSICLEHQVLINDHVSLVAFAMRNTSYFFIEETFGPDNDGNIVLLKPYRRLNLYTPTYGIKLRVILQPQNADISMPFNLLKSN